jgi:Arc/MetJ-type ribon-helix-helix transcriptional regulator
MTKPTTIRLPEDLLSEIDQYVQDAKPDRSVYLREILKKGFSLDKQERVLQKYVAGELSQMEVYRALSWNPWQFVDELRTRNLYLSVSLEDFLDSSGLRNSEEIRITSAVIVGELYKGAYQSHARQRHLDNIE